MFTTRPEIVGTFGVVASTHWLATAAGMAMLEKGGNAFDAAVATGLSLHILEPDQNGPGGDVPLILYCAQRDEVKVICGQGSAPGVFASVGYNGVGVARGTAAGTLLADLAVGAESELLRDVQGLGESTRVPPKPLLGLGVRARIAYYHWFERGER